jgi:hypothetical protein
MLKKRNKSPYLKLNPLTTEPKNGHSELNTFSKVTDTLNDTIQRTTLSKCTYLLMNFLNTLLMLINGLWQQMFTVPK